MKFYFTFSFLMISLFSLSQKQDTLSRIKPGKYGSYSDISTYKELILNEDYTFSYTDRFELASTVTINGKWKKEEKYLILYDFQNDKSRALPTKWIWSNDQLCGKVNRKFNYCLKKVN